MCGIIGYVSGDKYDRDKILKVLSHRGPNDSGFYEDIFFNKNIFLGHTLLKITDLSPASKQPMFSDDKQVMIIYNGEIYNYKTLRAEYLKNKNFNSDTDTEVILRLYESYGIKMLEYLIGDFAVAILDKNINMIFLARDRMGVKPLYYYIKDSHFVFGSEIKPMLQCGIAPSLSTENIEKYFVFKYVPGSETLFNNIYRLKPASVLGYNITNGFHSIKPFWELKEKDEYKNISYNDAKFHLSKLVEESIASQTKAKVPVGTLFSGGLDSSIIALTLRDHPEITHYTARKTKSDLKKEGTTSDFYFANKLATELSLKIKPVDIGTDELNSDIINKVNFYSDDLIADGSQIPSYLITKKASKTSTVLLSGMGADELFYGYAGHKVSLLSMYLDSFPKFFTNPLISLLKNLSPGKGFLKAYKRYLKKFGNYFSLGNLRYGFFNIVGDFNNSLSVFNSGTNAAERFFNKYFDNSSRQLFSKEDTFKAITRFEFDNFLVKNLHYLDRMCMANSMEGRVPFLDYRIVEFAYNLPLHYKLSRYGVLKRILKDSFSNKLPQYIIKRRKAGFGMPLRSIFSSDKKIKELLDEEFFLSLNGFSIENIRRIIKNHLSGIEDNSSIIYALISFQEWYKLFIKS